MFTCAPHTGENEEFFPEVRFLETTHIPVTAPSSSLPESPHNDPARGVSLCPFYGLRGVCSLPEVSVSKPDRWTQSPGHPFPAPADSSVMTLCS